MSSDVTDTTVIDEELEIASTNIVEGIVMSAVPPTMTTFESAIEVATGPTRSTMRLTFGNTVCDTFNESLKTTDEFLFIT
jgi:hypothetical protein